jgi:cytoskeletal protein RodZ
MATKATPATRSKHTQLNLQSRRMDCGLSLDKIAETTKISMRFLQAIEDEEFEKLPGGIFNRSYLRQYADAIGFDEGKLLTFYSRRTEAQAPAEVAIRKPNTGIRRWFGVQAAAGR